MNYSFSKWNGIDSSKQTYTIQVPCVNMHRKTRYCVRYSCSVFKSFTIKSIETGCVEDNAPVPCIWIHFIIPVMQNNYRIKRKKSRLILVCKFLESKTYFTKRKIILRKNLDDNKIQIKFLWCKEISTQFFHHFLSKQTDEFFK